jgi:Rrf2 family protein
MKALALLATLPPDQHLGAATVADRIGAPRNYLGKLLQLLARTGLVEGQKGVNGGFRLAQPPESITLLDVIEPIEHVSRWNGCFLGRPSCTDHDSCALHDRWSPVRETYLTFLRSTTIADIAGSEE